MSGTGWLAEPPSQKNLQRLSASRQTLLNVFREPQHNFLVPHLLKPAPSLTRVLLSDLASAFERVDPHWVVWVCLGLQLIRPAPSRAPPPRTAR